MKQNLLILSQGVTEILILVIYFILFYFVLFFADTSNIFFVQDVSISVIVFPSACSIVGKFLQARFSKLILSVSLTVYK